MIIDQLPALATAGDNDEIAIEVGTTTYKIKKSDFLKEFMPKSGGEFTGNVTVGGVLDVTRRRASASLSSAGWYRVLTFNGSSDNDANGGAGSQIDFTIVRDNGDNRPENHNIRFHLIAGVIKFDSEQSTSNAMCIDKIRYCRNGSQGYVDIHYLYSTQNNVFVSFTVCDDYARQYRYVATNFTPAATSPVSPEMVVTEYSFVANTDALFKTVTLSNQSITSGYFIYQDSSITVNSKLQISQLYKSGEALGMFFILQPRAGDVVVYCRTGSGASPADNSTISVFLTIDNR